MEKKKVGFASGIGFILAAAGSAVGLGNLWGFPYKTSQNGGAAFVLIYIACVLLIGFVTMLSEIYLGRRSQANPMTAYKMVNKNLGWCGLVAIMIPAFIICYYSVLGGWTTKYALNSFSGNAGIVSTFSVNTGEVILYTALFLVLSVTIIMGGVKDGIEKASKVLMPVLFCILVAIAIYALTLGSGVREGLAFYLKPDFSGITFKSVLVAMGQAFYSLSLGMGIMITYGSYMRKQDSLTSSVVRIGGFDLGVSFIAGLLIVSAAFVAMGSGDAVAAKAGPSLMFVTLPTVFVDMGGMATIIGFLFFLLVLFAALTSAISLVETLVSIVHDGLQCTRAKALGIVIAFVVIAGAIINAGYNGLSFIEPLGAGSSILDFADFISNSVLMPIVALLTCVFVGWIVKPKTIIDEVRVSAPFKAAPAWTIMIKYIAPVLVIIILVAYVAAQFGFFSM